MNTKDTLQRGLYLSRTNWQLFVPTIVATVLAGLISLLGGAIAGSPTTEIGPGVGLTAALASAFSGQNFVVSMLFGALGAIVTLLGHGMTLVIAHQLSGGESADLGAAFAKVRQRVVPLVIASVLVGILVGIGTTLLVLPGVIVAYFLMFTFVGVIAADLDAFSAIKKSFNLVTGNFGESLILFLLLLAVGVLFAILSSIFLLIPVAGPVIGMLLSGIFVGFTSVLVLLGYNEFEKLPAYTPPLQVHAPPKATSEPPKNTP